MNRDEFYAAMAPHDDDARLRKILWTVYWRGTAQLRERIEDDLRPQNQPKVKPKKEQPDPAGILAEVTTFVGLIDRLHGGRLRHQSGLDDQAPEFIGRP